MSNVDLVSIVGHVSESLFSVQALVTALGYLLGLYFILSALFKFREVAESKAGGGNAKMFEPVAYLVCGAALLYLPSAVKSLTATFFGSSNILQYSSYNQYDIYSSMHLVIQTAGVIWFVRGCVLIAHSSHPSAQKGPKGEGIKGLGFLIAGIFAINFDATVGMLDYAMTGLIHWVWG